jgi:hypothetical protein
MVAVLYIRLFLKPCHIPLLSDRTTGRRTVVRGWPRHRPRRAPGPPEPPITHRGGHRARAVLGAEERAVSPHALARCRTALTRPLRILYEPSAYEREKTERNGPRTEDSAVQRSYEPPYTKENAGLQSGSSSSCGGKGLIIHTLIRTLRIIKRTRGLPG